MHNINLNTDGLIVNVLPIVSTESVIRIIGTDTELKVKISADFKDIPDKYHEDYFRMFGYIYNKDALINDKVTIPNVPKRGMWDNIKEFFK